MSRFLVLGSSCLSPRTGTQAQGSELTLAEQGNCQEDVELRNIRDMSERRIFSEEDMSEMWGKKRRKVRN